EFKWDGVRAVTYLDGGQVRVVTRNDRDVVDSYPELRRLLGRFPRRRLVLDGEIVALDPTGAPSFSLLQQRMHVRTPSPALRERVPVQLYVFDVLHLGGRRTVEVVVAGWKPGEGRREGRIGSLLLGVYDDAGRLGYAGNVGTGFTYQMLTDLARQLAPLGRATSPFDEPVPRPDAREARWVE